MVIDLGRRVRPNRAAAQASRSEISAKNRSLRSHDRVDSAPTFSVMAGLVPAIHVFSGTGSKTWMPGTSPGMTRVMPESRGSGFDASHRPGTTLSSPPHEPDQDQTRDRRSDADGAQDIVGRRQCALHRPAHPGRARREHQAFQHEQDTHTDEEVGERYGPHRMATSGLL